jgi:chromosome segregation ATPase
LTNKNFFREIANLQTQLENLENANRQYQKMIKELTNKLTNEQEDAKQYGIEYERYDPYYIEQFRSFRNITLQLESSNRACHFIWLIRPNVRDLNTWKNSIINLKSNSTNWYDKIL